MHVTYEENNHLQYFVLNIYLIICNLSIILFGHTCLIVFQVKLLKSLGLQLTLITGGSSPIYLFINAHGLDGGAMDGASKRQKETIFSRNFRLLDDDDY